MKALDSKSAAIRAASQVAREQGLVFDEPVVLRDLSNLVLRLWPSAVVARVATATGGARRGLDWLAREVAMADFLARAGAPAVPPSRVIDPGPHERDGLAISFWEYVGVQPEPAEPRAAGRALRLCHEALQDYPGALPEMAAWREAMALLARLSGEGAFAPDDAALMAQAARRLDARLGALALPMQALHGDAGLGNALNTAAGPLWTDWEDAHRGPMAWDLGCLHARAWILGERRRRVEAAMAGYGAAIDPDLLWLFVEARALQVMVWTLEIAKRHPAVRDRAEPWLWWFRRESANK